MLIYEYTNIRIYELKKYIFLRSGWLKSIKSMLLGIAFMILGGILVLDTATSIGGIEYIIVLLGLIVSIIGFLKDDAVS